MSFPLCGPSSQDQRATWAKSPTCAMSWFYCNSKMAKEHFNFQHEGCSAEVVLNVFLLGKWSLLQEVKPMFDTPQQGSARSVLTGLFGGYILGGVEGLGIEYLWVSGQHKLQRAPEILYPKPCELQKS